MTRLESPRRTAIRKARQRAFTLTELTVALLILSFLIGGLIMPLWRQIEASRGRDTQKMLESVREAIIGFAVINGRLPCPANPALATTAAGAGVEATVAAGPPAAPTGPIPVPVAPFNLWCATSNPGLGPVGGAGISIGVVPWITLGVPETDGWGRRITYAVTTAYADNGWCPSTIPAGSGSSFCVTHPGNVTFRTRAAAGPVGGVPATTVAAVIISHGPNGYNASLPTGAAMPANPVANAFDENTNNPGIATANFITRDVWPAIAGCNDNAGGSPMCEFDDLVLGIDMGRLVNRMVTAGRLP